MAVALLVSYNECKVNNIHTKHTQEIIIIVNTESFSATASITLDGKRRSIDQRLRNKTTECRSTVIDLRIAQRNRQVLCLKLSKPTLFFQ